MISIRGSVAELERCHQEKTLAVDCYRSAIQNLAHYTIEFAEQITEPQRRYLTALAESIGAGTQQTLDESRATLRGLLRDYRDKAAAFLGQMKEDLGGTARALEEILYSLTATDGDHETRLRNTLGRLREVANSSDVEAMRGVLLTAAGNIEEGLDQIRKQHQLAVAQFQVEIRMLHKRIDSLEAASSIDQLTTLFKRSEMEERIRSTPAGYCLVLARVNGFRLAEVHFTKEVAAELAGAFAKRLRNSLPPTATIGRWGREEFIAMVAVAKTEAITLAKWISEHVAGSYVCLQNGKAVRPSIQLTVAVIDSSGNSSDKTLERVAAFLTGG